MKKRISLLLIFAMVLSLIAVTPYSKAASAPSLSCDFITLLKEDDELNHDSIIIRGVKNSQIKNTILKSSDNDVVDVKQKDKTHFQVFGYDTGDATVTVIIKLKKKIAGKSKYNLRLKVKVKDTLRSTPTPITGNDAVKYISDREVDYDSANKRHKVFFALKDVNENRIAGSGNAEISITNNAGETVYNKNTPFSENDFSTWTWNMTGVQKYICCIFISDSELTAGSSNTGILTLKVTLNNGVYFSADNYNIFYLPTASIAPTAAPNPETSVIISLPSVPITLHEYSYNKSIEQTFIVNSIEKTIIKNSYDNKYKITLHFSGKKEYDSKGSGQSSSCKIGWKLYKADTDIVIKSGTCYSPAVCMGDSFEEDELIYDIEQGSYRLEILSTN